MGICVNKSGAVDEPNDEGGERGNNSAHEQAPVVNAGKPREKRVKVLLLGAGEAGKSTMAKQMKIFHLRGFSEEELRLYRIQVHQNIVKNMKTLVKGAENLYIAIQNEALARKLMTYDETLDDFVLTTDMAAEVKALWATDAGIREAYKRGVEFHLLESAAYYFDHLDRISQPTYKPNFEDILRARRLTVDAEEFEFVIDGYTFQIVDVGGQKGEREKWINFFQNNDAVIFFVALSEYDQKLYEDNTTNRMLESLKLFSDVANHQWFANACIILFLNKSDVFREKIQHVPITTAFPEYRGANTFEDASEYIKSRFIERVLNKKPVYPFITCATNTENFKSLFSAIKDIVVSKQQEREMGGAAM